MSGDSNNPRVSVGLRRIRRIRAAGEVPGPFIRGLVDEELDRRERERLGMTSSRPEPAGRLDGPALEELRAALAKLPVTDVSRFEALSGGVDGAPGLATSAMPSPSLNGEWPKEFRARYSGPIPEAILVNWLKFNGMNDGDLPALVARLRMTERRVRAQRPGIELDVDLLWSLIDVDEGSR